MPKLSDFFSPLNITNILIYIFLIIFFDVLGSYLLARILPKFSLKENRVVNWLVGMGFFIFGWFILSLFIPYNRTNIIASIVILIFVSVPEYLKQKKFTELISFLWSVKLGLLIIVPFLPAVYVKASLPPYFGDEMAYHYIPPAALITLEKVRYVGGFLADLPRTLNMLWELIFSLSNTYSIARLMHFSILVSAMLFAYAILRRYINFFAAFAFVFIFFSLPQDVILTSTLGYIDVGAYSFILVALTSFIAYAYSNKKEYLLLTGLFWAMNIGTKYTGISALLAFVFMSLLIFTKISGLKHIPNQKRFLIKLSFIVLVFGGYWYIKNFILYGNPIFPFLFDCWGKHVEPCNTGGAYFGEWTTKITLSSLPAIFSQLFVGNKILRLVILVAPLLLLFKKEKNIFKLSLVLYLSVFLELLMLKYFSGFYNRYQQHMQLYLLLGVIIILTSKCRGMIERALQYLLIILAITSSLYFYVSTVRHVNSLKFLNWTEIKYSVSQLDIYEWIRTFFPDSNAVISWCDGGPDATPIKLARFDPDLIWFTHDGLSRVYLMRCKYINPNINTDKIEDIVPSAIANKQSFWITSLNKCLKKEDIKPNYSYEQPYQTAYRYINNEIICNSTEVAKNLYYFDYTKLK